MYRTCTNNVIMSNNAKDGQNHYIQLETQFITRLNYICHGQFYCITKNNKNVNKYTYNQTLHIALF